jgi:hypothetical protein
MTQFQLSLGFYIIFAVRLTNKAVYEFSLASGIVGNMAPSM